MKPTEQALPAVCPEMLKRIGQRRSVRAFKPDPVRQQDLQLILETARSAPSGGNMQPWRVQVLGGQSIAQLNSAICAHIQTHGFTEVGDYQYYPGREEQAHWDLIRQSGQDLHAALEIGRRDIRKIREQKLRNFSFYGAPVGLIVTLDRKLATGSWIDVGLFLGTLVLAARGLNIGSCLQGCFSSYGDTVRDVLDLPPDDLVVCGIALGYAEDQAAVNQLPYRRKEIDQLVRFHP